MAGNRARHAVPLPPYARGPLQDCVATAQSECRIEALPGGRSAGRAGVLLNGGGSLPLFVDDLGAAGGDRELSDLAFDAK